MARFDDPTNPNICPTRWHSPVYGTGLTTTSEDSEKDGNHGYCFQPKTYSSIMHGFATPASHTKHGFNPELQEKSDDNRFNYGFHPFCATVEEAAKWMIDRNILGFVQRYAHLKPNHKRQPVFEFDTTYRECRWTQYRPWLTAGVVAYVTDKTELMYGIILGNDPNLKIFYLNEN